MNVPFQFYEPAKLSSLPWAAIAKAKAPSVLPCLIRLLARLTSAAAAAPTDCEMLYVRTGYYAAC